MRRNFFLYTMMLYFLWFSLFLYLNMKSRRGVHSEMREDYLTSSIHWDMGWPRTAYVKYSRDYWSGLSFDLSGRNPILFSGEYEGEWDFYGVASNLFSLFAGFVMISMLPRIIRLFNANKMNALAIDTDGESPPPPSK